MVMTLLLAIWKIYRRALGSEVTRISSWKMADHKGHQKTTGRKVDEGTHSIAALYAISLSVMLGPIELAFANRAALELPDVS